MLITLLELADFLCGKIVSGDGDLELNGFASLDEALPGDVAFFALERYRSKLSSTKASALLVPEGFSGDVPEGMALVEVAEPSIAFSKLVEDHCVPPPVHQPGVHPSASVDPTAQLGEGVSVLANGVVGKGVSLGANTEIGAGAVIGDRVSMGNDCKIHPNATVGWGCTIGNRVILHSGCVIGADGFGFEFVDGKHQKVEQVGIVEIEDDVEIGAASTVDRARFGRTRIREGTKIDNQVQIGHNTVIGRHCIIVAGVDIAGSSRIGDYVTIAAQVGIAGHLQVADKVILGARTGVTKNITEPGMYLGFPHQSASDEKRQLAHVRRLGGLSARVRALEKRLESEGSD